MGSLRDEVLGSQQTRSDLLKWKLGLVGAIGAVGLGLAGSRVATHADLVLCAVPLVCVYVDLLCRHLSLRILVIGAFLRTSTASEAGTVEGSETTTLAAYERHVQRARDSAAGDAFALEDWAVSWSTMALSIAVLVYGAAVLAGNSTDNVAVGSAFIVSGAVGGLTTAASQRLYEARSRALTRGSVA